MRYYKQLDALRALCLSLVIWNHWFQSEVTLFLTPGIFGVNSFFVVSGFLISEILLRQKIRVESGEIKIKNYFKNFYAKRAIRIFPVYFVTVGLLLYYNVFSCRTFAIYYLTYTTNLWQYFNQDWTNFGHLWSLAVEEQFYLVWPVAILMISKGRLKPLFYLLIIIAPLFRLISGYFLDNSFTFSNPFAVIDGFAFGAMLAHIVVYDGYSKFESISFKFEKMRLPFLLIFLILIFSCYNYYSESLKDLVDLGYIQPLYFSSTFLLACYLIIKFSSGFTGLLGTIFSNKGLIYVGKISYSLYIFHNILPEAVGWFGYSSIFPFSGLWKILYLFVLFCISALSWEIFERPINSLKKYFS